VVFFAGNLTSETITN